LSDRFGETPQALVFSRAALHGGLLDLHVKI
jgi:hypothetical protein